MKTISNPPEAAITRLFTDQKKLRTRIIELTPRYQIKNATRFKYLLAHAYPSAKLTDRLWRILEKHPEYYRSVCNYLRRYPKLSRVPAEKLVESRQNEHDLPSRPRGVYKCCRRPPPPAQDKAIATLLKKSWSPKAMHADLQVATGRFLIRTGNLSPNQIKYACKVAPSWWTRASLINALDSAQLGGKTLHQIVDAGVKDRGHDVALAASWKGFEQTYLPPGKRKEWNKSAELLMREVGLIKRSSASHCGINHALQKLDSRIPAVNWKKLFGVLAIHKPNAKSLRLSPPPA